MKSVSGYLQDTVQSVQTLLGNSKETNGPEGTVASKTIRSVNMINQGLARLQSNIAKINPELRVNPEALLTVQSRETPRSFPFQKSNMYAVTLCQGFWDYSPGISKKNDALVRFLLHTLNIVLSCTFDTISPSRFSQDDATKPACHEFS